MRRDRRRSRSEFMAEPNQMTAVELKALIDAQAKFCLLDVREAWEVALASIPGSLHIPLNELPSRWQELDAAAGVIVMCKSGGRSQRAAQFLVAQGLGRVSNLQGGILGWARDIDPGTPEY